MNILAIGDVVGSIGCKFLRAHLPQLKKVKGVDLVIANGENSADGNGITPTSARFLFDSGVDVITAGNHTFRIQVGVLNLMGVVYMESMDSPFDVADRILAEGVPKITLVDMHAEATGEKRSLAYYLDGRVSAVFGTHTHVQTADEGILDNGTGYISDLGMTGPKRSVLGVKPELVIQKMRTKMPVRFDLADGACQMGCVLFTIDEKTGKTTAIERLLIE